jgi:hypothetical protein
MAYLYLMLFGQFPAVSTMLHHLHHRHRYPIPHNAPLRRGRRERKRRKEMVVGKDKPR